MNTVPLVFASLLMVAHSYQSLPMEKLEDVLVYPIEPTSHVRKRETSKTLNNKEKNFIEEKLIQHTRALEHLVKMVQNNEDMTRSLIENLSKQVDPPQLPEKFQVHRQTRRSSNDENDFPLVRIGKQVPKYGMLIKNMILGELRSSPESPISIVEVDEPVQSEFLSRRSFNGPPVVVPSQQNNNQVSPWCTVAMVCHRTLDPVCGYDDNFGYGKFDDICHMLQVNCYWKLNFSLVPSCRPT